MNGKFSDGHYRYLCRLKRQNATVNLIRAFILIFTVFLWQTAADKGWINSVITSSPTKIAGTVAGMIKDGSIFRHIAVTLFETITGFTLATILGILTGSFLWAFPSAAKVTDPYLVVLNALPKVALGPLIILWAGAGTKAIIIMTLSISLISTVISVYSGLTSVSGETITLMRSFNADRLQILKFALLPASCRSIIGALKINVSLSWVGVIMGEFLVSKAGIGYLIMYGSQVFNLDLVMSGIIILCILAGGMYLLVNLFEKWAEKKGWLT